MSTHNLCFVQKYEKYLSFLSENFQFLEVKFCIYLNRRVFVMQIIQFSILNFKSDCLSNKDLQYNKTFFISTMKS